jgi:hypothetical protein
MLIDAHPRVRPWLGNPSIPLLATEGVRKADSALSAAVAEGKEICTVAIAGVSTWRGKNEHGGLTALADWEGIAFNQRTAYVAYDSDAVIKRDVQQQEKRLARLFEAKQAKVKIIRLPAGPDGEKVGVDDYLAAGHTIHDLLALATDFVDEAPATNGVKFPFRLTEHSVEFADEEDGYIDWQWVCSPLEVVAKTRTDAGEDWGRLLVLKDSDGREHQFAIPMEMLAGDGVVYREHLLRLGLVIAPGRKARERLHQYISMTSPSARVRSVSHLGWHGRNFVLPDEVI